MRYKQGIYIPIELWEREDLNWTEKLILIHINSVDLSAQKVTSYINKSMLEVEKKDIGFTITSLLNRGFIIQDIVNNELVYRISLDPKPNNATNALPVVAKKALGKPKLDFVSELIRLGVSEQVARDWMQVRKSKKAQNTPTAFVAIERELNKAMYNGVDANDCISEAVTRNWTSFKYEWYQSSVSLNRIKINSRIEDNLSAVSSASELLKGIRNK